MAIGDLKTAAATARAHRLSAVRAFGSSALLGAALWAISPHITGHPEPWDGNFGFYIVGLFAVGLISCLLTPRLLWVHYSGSVCGQVAYTLFFTPLGAFAALGAVFLAFYSLVALAGAAVGLGCRSITVVPLRRA